MQELTIKIYEIEKDGLPLRPMADTEMAFIFDGCIVSGWPLYGGPDHDNNVYSGYWEANDDVGRNVKFAGVTHWVEFPEPLHKIAPLSAPI